MDRCTLLSASMRRTLFFIFVSGQLFLAVVSVRVDIATINTIMTPGLRTLLRVFEKNGYKNESSLRMVGGAVRDLLNGQKPLDLDFATVATIQEMKDMFAKASESIHTVNRRGEAHGTATVLIVDQKETFEISTLRMQTMVDGKVTNITFIRDWYEDSLHRDFTTNAMYMDFEGNVYDYHNGYEDLKNNRVKFVGDPRESIIEDPRLILRYFRVFQRVAKDTSQRHDEEILRAIRENASRLSTVLGPRMWLEVERILVGRTDFIESIVKMMLTLGLAPYLGLGENPDELNITCFEMVCEKVGKYQFRAPTFIVSLLSRRDQVSTFSCRTNLPRADRTIMYTILYYLKSGETLPADDDECVKYLQRKMTIAYAKDHVGIVEVLKILDREPVMKRISEWTPPELKMDFKKLKEHGISDPQQIGQFMKKLKAAWFDNAYVMNDDLLARVASEFHNESKINSNKTLS